MGSLRTLLVFTIFGRPVASYFPDPLFSDPFSFPCFRALGTRRYCKCFSRGVLNGDGPIDDSAGMST